MEHFIPKMAREQMVPTILRTQQNIGFFRLTGARLSVKRTFRNNFQIRPFPVLFCEKKNMANRTTKLENVGTVRPEKRSMNLASTIQWSRDLPINVEYPRMTSIDLGIDNSS